VVRVRQPTPVHFSSAYRVGGLAEMMMMAAGSLQFYIKKKEHVKNLGAICSGRRERC
jgi:hypothetical protein